MTNYTYFNSTDTYFDWLGNNYDTILIIDAWKVGNGVYIEYIRIKK